MNIEQIIFNILSNNLQAWVQFGANRIRKRMR